MGWSVGWGSRAELLAYLQTGWNPETHVVLDTGSTFKAVYHVVRNIVTDERFIHVCLIKKYGKEWGYKSMDESWGPNVCDCPIRLLGQSTCEAGSAVAWRKACFAHHRHKSRRQRYVAQLKAGDTVMVRNTPYVMADQSWYWRKKGAPKYLIAGGFRIRPSQIELRPTT